MTLPSPDYATRLLRETRGWENQWRREFLRRYEGKSEMSDERVNSMTREEALEILAHVGLKDATITRVRGLHFVKAGAHHYADRNVGVAAMAVLNAELAIQRRAEMAETPSPVESHAEEAGRREKGKGKPKAVKEENEPPSE